MRFQRHVSWVVLVLGRKRALGGMGFVNELSVRETESNSLYRRTNSRRISMSRIETEIHRIKGL